MPHLKLEYSPNIKEELDPKALFSRCHQILVDVAKAKLLDCHSRALRSDRFYIGDGLANEAFVYLEILLLEGRSAEQLKEVGNKTLKWLKEYFSLSLSELNLQIEVRLVEFPSSHYFKLPPKQ